MSESARYRGYDESICKCWGWDWHYLAGASTRFETTVGTGFWATSTHTWL
jgi:hypothetical protein